MRKRPGNAKGNPDRKGNRKSVTSGRGSECPNLLRSSMQTRFLVQAAEATQKQYQIPQEIQRNSLLSGRERDEITKQTPNGPDRRQTRRKLAKFVDGEEEESGKLKLVLGEYRSAFGGRFGRTFLVQWALAGGRGCNVHRPLAGYATYCNSGRDSGLFVQSQWSDSPWQRCFW